MSGVNLRRPMGFFAPFNSWWSSFFLEHGRRPTKTDIRMWRADNPKWRPELTLEEIIQHSKGRRDPARNRQYFVEYRRKIKGRVKRTLRECRGPVSKRASADEPWEESTSAEDDEEEEGVDIVQTYSPKRPQLRKYRRVQILEQACLSAAPAALSADKQAADPEVAKPTGATVLEAAVDPGGPSSCWAVCGGEQNSGAGSGHEPPSLSPAAPAPAPPEPVASVTVRLPVRRARGPSVAKRLRCEATHAQLPVHDVIGAVCRGREGRSNVHKTAATTDADIDAGIFSWVATAEVAPLTAVSTSCPTETFDVLPGASDQACQRAAAYNGFSATPSLLPAYLQIPEPTTLPCCMPGVLCWNAGEPTHGTMPTSVALPLPFAAVNQRMTSCQMAAGAQLTPGCGRASYLVAVNTDIDGPITSGGAVGSASVSGATDTTLPFYDPYLHRTCSIDSVSTGGILDGPSDIPNKDSIATGWVFPYRYVAAGADGARRAVLAATATVTARGHSRSWNSPCGSIPEEAAMYAFLEPTLAPSTWQCIDVKAVEPQSQLWPHDAMAVPFISNDEPCTSLSFGFMCGSEGYDRAPGCVTIANGWAPGDSDDLPTEEEDGRQSDPAMVYRGPMQLLHAAPTPHRNVAGDGPRKDSYLEQLIQQHLLQHQPSQEHQHQPTRSQLYCCGPDLDVDSLDTNCFDNLFLEFMWEAPFTFTEEACGSPLGTSGCPLGLLS